MTGVNREKIQKGTLVNKSNLQEGFVYYALDYFQGITVLLAGNGMFPGNQVFNGSFEEVRDFDGMVSPGDGLIVVPCGNSRFAYPQCLRESATVMVVFHE